MFLSLRVCAHVKDPISICRQRVGLTASGAEARKHCTQEKETNYQTDLLSRWQKVRPSRATQPRSKDVPDCVTPSAVQPTSTFRGGYYCYYYYYYYYLLKACSPVSRTGSPQGFSQVQISHKLNTIQNMHIT